MPSCPEHFNLPKQHEAVRTYYSLRRATIDRIADVIKKFEPDLTDPGSFNLIALHKYPIVDLDNSGSYCLYCGGLAESLLDGVYHAAREQWDLEGKGPSPAYINGLYGNIFETYVLDILTSVVGDRLLRNPKRISNLLKPSSRDSISCFLILLQLLVGYLNLVG